MSIKEDLHELVDQMSDDRASEALALLRRFLGGDEASGETAQARLQCRMSPRIVAGSAFRAGQQPTELPALAARQGVRPVTSFEDLLGDFWPEDETAAMKSSAVREWRRDSGYA